MSCKHTLSMRLFNMAYIYSCEYERLLLFFFFYERSWKCRQKSVKGYLPSLICSYHITVICFTLSLSFFLLLHHLFFLTISSNIIKEKYYTEKKHPKKVLFSMAIFKKTFMVWWTDLWNCFLRSNLSSNLSKIRTEDSSPYAALLSNGTDFIPRAQIVAKNAA